VNFEVIYSAAHAEFPDTEPLGGGKAVADYLIREWQESSAASRGSPDTGVGATGLSTTPQNRDRNVAPTNAFPFELTVLSPKSVGLGRREAACPAARSRVVDGVAPYRLTEMTELEYARFCREFERAVTAEILKRDPRRCVVLSNDISEGPDFAALGERGYRIVTILHVDVVEYFTTFYLRGLVKPETVARFRWFGWLPDVLRLVFQKQFECVRHSLRLVVPSAPMRDTIGRCYPWCPPEKIVVLPWGDVSASITSVAAVYDRRPAISPERSTLTERRYTIDDNEFVVLTLSRLSPEKGIERLLAALPRVETSDRRLRLFICGAPAYMKGRTYERKLRRRAARITNARIEFTGHVSGETKAALLQRADVFVSPSRHESYGLTIAEAQAAGCRVISHSHYGATGLVVDCTNPAALANAINGMITDGRTRKTGVLSPPTRAAAQLAGLLASVAEDPMPPSCGGAR